MLGGTFLNVDVDQQMCTGSITFAAECSTNDCPVGSVAESFSTEQMCVLACAGLYVNVKGVCTANCPKYMYNSQLSGLCRYCSTNPYDGGLLFDNTTQSCTDSCYSYKWQFIDAAEEQQVMVCDDCLFP